MAWTTKAGERPAEPKAAKADKLPYPDPIPLRGATAAPRRPASTRARKGKDQPRPRSSTETRPEPTADAGGDGS